MKIFGPAQAAKILPKKPKRSNKSDFGKSLIIAGSKGMFGAAVLACSAAARVGSGYVFLKTDKRSFPSGKHPDFLIVDPKKALTKIKFDSVGFGPGLGLNQNTKKLLKKLISLKLKAVVLDADALNALAKIGKVKLPSSWILTPHEGELARLLKVSSQVVKKDRKASVIQAQKKFGCVVLLKGHQTLIANGKNIFEIASGNSSLAKAGTGDVLTGMITGFYAQGLTATEAACLGAYIHGSLADRWITLKKDVSSLMASDLLDLIPDILYRIRKHKGRNST